MRRLDCHTGIKQVTSSYQTALQTVNILIGIVENQPKYLHQYKLALDELHDLRKGLHDIYFVRMFACFESNLRNYWMTSVKKSRPLTYQLLSSIAGRRGIPQDVLDTVHEIRDFRNYLIHEEHEVRRRFTIVEASRYLNTFLARLPIKW